MAEKDELYFEGGAIIACTRLTAEYFGVTPATLSNWMRAGCPRYKHGYWDIRAVTDWRGKQEGEKLAAAAASDPSKLTPAQQKVHYEAQLKEAQLEAARLRNRFNSGMYLERATVVDELAKYFIVLKHSLLGLGHELSLMVSPYVDADRGRQIDRTIDERVKDMLEQMAVEGVYDAKISTTEAI